MTKILALLTIVLATSAAHAQAYDPRKDLNELEQGLSTVWYREDGKAWGLTDSSERCRKAIAQLDKNGVPGSTTFDLSSDVPELAKGKHTLDEARPVCTKTYHYGLIKKWEYWAVQTVEEAGKLGGGSYIQQAYFTNCADLWDELVKAGVPKTTKVLERQVTGPDRNKMLWAGTVEELHKKWCEAGNQKVNAAKATDEAPYRKVLKSDKLTMALQTGAFYVPGGAVTSDPKKLAAAKVWFSDTQSVNSDRKLCRGGAEIHVVHRYQFDATHKLVKTTDTQYCGKVPARAFK